MMRSRARRALARHGWRETLRWTRKRGLGRVVLSERHTWYVLDLASERPKPRLPPGLILRRGTEADLELVEAHSTPADDAAGRLREGEELWLVLDGNRLLFSCWIFHSRSPAIAAPGGQFALPADAVCQEESITTRPARGLGIAPAAWAGIADVLARDGWRYVIRKVEDHNASGRRAGDKAGFRTVAAMRFIRIGPVSWTAVEPLDDEIGPELARRLSSTPPLSDPAVEPR